MPGSTAQGPNGAFFIALKRCRKAWNQSLAKSGKKGLDNSDAIKAAQQAYLLALPVLCGRDEIRAHLACVEEGMESGAIEKALGTKLRRIAYGALRLTRHPRAGRPPKNPPPQPAMITSLDNSDATQHYSENQYHLLRNSPLKRTS